MKKRFAPILLAACSLVLAACDPPPAPAVVSSTKTPEASRADTLIAKAQGDINNLSADELAELNKITRGNASMIISSGKK